MALQQIERQDDYVRYLQREPSEIQALFRDLLIGVTSFFRDREAFAILETDIIPRLFANKPAGGTVRVWVCGCSSGEEAYSIAILMQEYLNGLRQAFRVQIFATDVDAQAVAQARAGVYPASIASDVSPERLARFFTLDQDSGVYRIQKGIRDLVVFSEQDLIRDPPFSRLDLLSCRNLLIYLDGNLQRKLIPLFHYALNPAGVLFLGSSESIGDALTLFSPLDRKWKLYARLDPVSGAPAPMLGDRAPHPRVGAEPLQVIATEPPTGSADLRALTEGELLQHFNAVGVLTNARGDICFIHGRSGLYLEPAAGTVSINIFQMAREGLRRPLTTALQRAVTRQEIVRTPNLKVKTNGDFTHVDLSIRPVRPSQRSERADACAELYLVILEPAASGGVEAPGTDTIAGAAANETPWEHRIAGLEQELRAKEDYLQTTLEEMETSNEELKSTNEEMQSVNEELQSTNEELETSKEELQSVNEELATVNAELQAKVADLSRANDDMNNLLAGTGVATLFVDDQLRISRFTPAMTQIIKLIPRDIGRPVGDIVSNLVDYPELVDDLDAVVRTLIPREKVVQTVDGAWFLMRIGPYRTLSNVIEGAVMTFVDISSRKRMEEELRTARAFAEGVVEAAREPLAVLDDAGTLVSANRAFYRRFQMRETEALGKTLFDLGQGEWKNPALHRLIAALESPGDYFDDYPFEHDVPGLGRRRMLVNARRLSPISGQAGAILLAFGGLNTPSPIDDAADTQTQHAESTGDHHDQPS
jgi:two-component system CheB/CheR fusion protein